MAAPDEDGRLAPHVKPVEDADVRSDVVGSPPKEALSGPVIPGLPQDPGDHGAGSGEEPVEDALSP
eukprot:1389674-Prorocentrum_lima.AAC.1